MNKILIIGAGRSATALINYLLQKAIPKKWSITLADANLELAQEKVANHPTAKAVELDIMNEERRHTFIKEADLVVSMLPAFLHIKVATDCIEFGKHLVTASYISKEMKALDGAAKEKGLIFMGEIGLDPGIDHMSAIQKIDEIKEKGGMMTAFRSYTGGLIAPECDDNPWHYKFTWNPRNVVLAGKATAQYLEDNTIKFMPYNRLFKHYRLTEISGMGTYEVYANRDSLSYKKIYGLENVPTILRGTIRTRGFCEAWNALLKIGLTDNDFSIIDADKMTYVELMNAFARPGAGTVKERIAELIEEKVDGEVMAKLAWLGLFENNPIEQKKATPAFILENLLLKKWKLKPDDKDMIIMKHEFEYALNGKNHHLSSTLVLKGDDQVNTGMAKTVGLPMGIFVRLVMDGEFTTPGVLIPVMKEAYNPVLKELEEYGIIFKEEEN